MTVAIIGYGHVGKGMHKVFPDAYVYDEPLGIGYRQVVNQCSIAFVCVPTPESPTGEADVSIVEDVVGWLEPLVVIKSAVPPGTTGRLANTYHKRVVVSPEFIGEGPTWMGIGRPYSGIRDWPYVLVGGGTETDFAELQRHTSAAYEADEDLPKFFWYPNSRTVELVKYMENVWLAQQVTFANEFYEIAKAVGADYERARVLWALDPRVSASHTHVYPDARGFGGKCLPKDLAAIIACAYEHGYDAAYLATMQHVNECFNKLSETD